MPQPRQVTSTANELIRIYEQAWMRIVEEEKRILRAPNRARRRARLLELRTRVEIEMLRLDVQTKTWLRDRFPTVYRAGARTGAMLADAEFNNWTTLHRGAVQRLAEDLFDDLLTATRFVRKDTKRFIREAAKIATEVKATTGQTAVQAGRQLEDVLRDRGITSVIYRNGARHGLAEYSGMVLRTKSALAYNAGTLNGASQQGGVKFFEIFDGPGCGLTGHGIGPEANGMVVSLDEARGNPIAHPNCQRGFGPRVEVTSRRAARRAAPTREEVPA